MRYEGKIHLWLIRLIGVLVPRRLRADWRQEWEAELQWREQELVEWDRLNRKNKWSLFWHSAGAFVDALYLQPKRLEEDMMQDLRYGIRMLLKHKGSTFIAVVTLALGIGANTTIFSAMEALILHPFSFPQQDRLTVIYERKLEAGIRRAEAAPGNLQDWREQSQMFEQFVTMRVESYDLTGVSQPERFSGYSVSAGFFAALGVQPLLGRTFQAGEDTAGREQVVVLKHSLWQRRFGANPNVIGQPLTLNGKAYTIIGVMPEDFNFPYNGGELWTPFVFPAESRQDRESRYFRVLGVLKPGVTLAQGEAEIRSLSQRAQTLYPATNRGVEAVTVGLNADYTRGARLYFLFLLGAVAFVLLIACANVANLLLVRGSARQKELALRMALGAKRGRILRQLLTESMLLALLGGVVGLGLSVWGVQAMASAVPQGFAQFIPGWEHLGVNAWALGFTLLVSLLTGVLFGLLPAWQAIHTNFNQALKEGSKGVTSGARQRLRSGLVVAEVALSLVLLVGAGLLLRSFIVILNTDFGFDPENTISMRIVLPKDRYAQAEQRVQLYQELERRVASLPGIAQVGAVDYLPLGGWSASNYFQIVGHPAVPKAAQPSVDVRVVTPGYFAAIGTPLRAGRLLTAQDDTNAPRALLVNEAFARRYFTGRQALGQYLTFDSSPPYEIVGIVANVMNDDLDDPAEPSIYQPHAQRGSYSMALVVRGQPNQAGPEGVTQLVGAIRQELTKLDANLPLSEIKLLHENIRERSSPKRVITAMLGVFALLALLMATVGLYAVMSFAVAQRTHEIGIRLALGAQMKDVAALIVRQGLRLVLIGGVIGLAGAFAVSRVLSQILFGITANDPVTYFTVAGVVLLTAAIACWVPARRAAKVDPMIALRHE